MSGIVPERVYEGDITSITDGLGYVALNTATGELRTITPVLIVGGNFEGNTIDSNFWLSTVANSATNTESGGVLTMTSGTNTAGSAQINSIRRARFIPNTTNRFRALIQISDGGIANNTRRWGIAYGATMPTITDGAYFQLSGTTFSIVTLKGGVETTVSSGSFNGELGTSYSITTNVTTYEIYYSNSSVKFVIGGVTLHTVSALATTWTNTTEVYTYLSNINSGNTTSVDLACRVLGIVRLGRLLTQPISKYQSGTTAGVVCKYGGGALHSIAVSGVSNNSVVTLYDNTAASGTVIWASGTMGANTVPFSISLEAVPFFTGLTLVISGANSTVTVIYE